MTSCLELFGFCKPTPTYSPSSLVTCCAVTSTCTPLQFTSRYSPVRLCPFGLSVTPTPSCHIDESLPLSQRHCFASCCVKSCSKSNSPLCDLIAIDFSTTCPAAVDREMPPSGFKRTFLPRRYV